MPDPNGRNALSAGSYFVFRKLEQNVRGFNARDIGHEQQAYMASIEEQFEFTQQSRANNPIFAGNINPEKPHPVTGIDSIIGQSATPSGRQHTYLDG